MPSNTEPALPSAHSAFSIQQTPRGRLPQMCALLFPPPHHLASDPTLPHALRPHLTFRRTNSIDRRGLQKCPRKPSLQGLNAFSLQIPGPHATGTASLRISGPHATGTALLQTPGTQRSALLPGRRSTRNGHGVVADSRYTTQRWRRRIPELRRRIPQLQRDSGASRTPPRHTDIAALCCPDAAGRDKVIQIPNSTDDISR
jgi:hypothetical protein